MSNHRQSFTRLGLLLALAPAAVFAEGGARVEKVSYDPGTRSVVVEVTSPTAPSWSDFELADPHRVILDLSATSAFPGNNFTAPVGDGLVERVRAALNQPEPPLTRVVVDLSAGVDSYAVRLDGRAPSFTVILDLLPSAEVRRAEDRAREVEYVYSGDITVDGTGTGASPPLGGEWVIAASPTAVREAPSVAARRVSEALAGERVRLAAELDDWSLVILSEQSELAGWVRSAELAPAGTVARDEGGIRVVPNPRTPPPGTPQTPQPDRAPLRAEASEGSAIIAHLRAGTDFNAWRRRGDWYFIVLADGRAGWVQGAYIALEDAFDGPVPPWRQAVIATAEAYLGRPYVWGGTTEAGFDCSGLVWRVFRQNGIEIPRTSGPQYREGVKLRRDELLPGDLVFFSTYTSGPSHVGIYVGDGRFIQAESSPEGVRYSSLEEPYWKQRVFGYTRWSP